MINFSAEPIKVLVRTIMLSVSNVEYTEPMMKN